MTAIPFGRGTKKHFYRKREKRSPPAYVRRIRVFRPTRRKRRSGVRFSSARMRFAVHARVCVSWTLQRHQTVRRDIEESPDRSVGRVVDTLDYAWFCRGGPRRSLRDSRLPPRKKRRRENLLQFRRHLISRNSPYNPGFALSALRVPVRAHSAYGDASRPNDTCYLCVWPMAYTWFSIGERTTRKISKV